MCPGFGVAHSDQPARHGYGRVPSVSTLYRILAKSAKRFCALKDFVCKWYPSLEVESLHVQCMKHGIKLKFASQSAVIEY